MKYLPFLMVFMILFSCSVFPLKEKSGEGPSSDEEVTRIRTLVFEEDFKGAKELGRLYLHRFKDGKDAGEVRVYIGRAELKLGNSDLAAEVVGPVIEGDYPDKFKIDAYIIKAKANVSKGLFSTAARDILEAAAFQMSAPQLSEAKEIIFETGGMLSVEDIEELSVKYKTSSLLPVLLRECLKVFAASKDKKYEERVKGIISELETADLSERNSIKAPDSRERTSTFRIGIICPLSGRFSKLGESFVNGAVLALKEARRGGITNLELVVGDTKANSLDAYSITKNLIEDEKVDVIIGGISSSSTVAAAQVAQSNKVILFSPVASERGIDSIGDHIFQDLRNYDAEIIALAKVACCDLGIRRIAFLASNNPLNRRIELLFKEEVKRDGGVVCAVDYYDEGCTDFRKNIDKIRTASPEALFIPSDQDDLVLILPQLSFYEFGVQLLGLSTWDSDDLIQIAGKDMNGAVFPAVTGLSRERELYLSAASYIGEPEAGANRYEVKGYMGTKRVIDLLNVNNSGISLSKKMEYLLNNRLHPYLEAILSEGISFYTVKNGKKETIITQKADLINKSGIH